MRSGVCALSPRALCRALPACRRPNRGSFRPPQTQSTTGGRLVHGRGPCTPRGPAPETARLGLNRPKNRQVQQNWPRSVLRLISSDP